MVKPYTYSNISKKHILTPEQNKICRNMYNSVLKINNKNNNIENIFNKK